MHGSRSSQNLLDRALTHLNGIWGSRLPLLRAFPVTDLSIRPATVTHGQRSILVTGCSSGIGAHCARALKADGWRVFATARKPEDIAALTADGLEALYLDYADEASIHACADAVLAATGGRLDALFNNGAFAQAGAVEDLPTDALRAQFEAAFFGWHTLTRRIVPVMRAQGQGRIILNSSMLGVTPIRWRGAYNAAKHAIEGLMVTLAYELAGSGVHLSLIEPGPITSKIASNGLERFKANIDIEGSVHREAYLGQLQRLQQGGKVSRLKLGPEAVYAVLTHALNARRPRMHYPVTLPAKMTMLLRRLLPSGLYHRLVAGYQ
jgi:NAD(P)-dependent dehydrogenase (short-subunit alcohol dehydrogenase family)